MDAAYLSKLLKKSFNQNDEKCFLYVHSQWNSSGIEFMLQDTQTGHAWTGKTSFDEMQEAASDFEMQYEQFKEVCREALTANISLPGFEYEIDDDENTFKLWKIEELPLQYIAVQLTKLKNNFKMLDAAITQLASKETIQLEKINTETACEKDTNEILESYERCITEKNELADKMLRKFTMLLNSKKAELSRLKRKLEENGEKRPNKRMLSSDSEDDAAYAAATQPMTPP